MRKTTTPVHLGLGMLAALLAVSAPVAAILLFAGFALYEYWADQPGHAEGCADFHEALLGLGVMSLAMLACQSFLSGWC